MKYRAYFLEFLTPVHFADNNFGGDLEKASFYCSADTYFSAICSEANLISKEILQSIMEKFEQRKLAISSLFPYYYSAQNDDLQLYLPKIYLSVDNLSKIDSYSEQKKYSRLWKQNDKEDFIRISEIKNWLQSINDKEVYSIDNPIFAIENTMEKVACRGQESLPYFVNSYKFNDNAGLYFILGYEDDDDAIIMEKIIESLGYSGIGGKKSSGYGKYKFFRNPKILNGEISKYRDVLILTKMINMDMSVNRGRKLCIAPLLPRKEDVKYISVGNYKIVKRSGFIYDQNTHNKKRKNNLYMLAEGSCLMKYLEGMILKEEYEGISYPIYRNGMGMFVGIDYE